MTFSRVVLQSATPLRAAYHHQPPTLRLQFLNGAFHTYSGVPREVFRALLAAPSIGAFFNRHIRGSYAFVKDAEEN